MYVKRKDFQLSRGLNGSCPTRSWNSALRHVQDTRESIGQVFVLLKKIRDLEVENYCLVGAGGPWIVLLAQCSGQES